MLMIMILGIIPVYSLNKTPIRKTRIFLNGIPVTTTLRYFFLIPVFPALGGRIHLHQRHGGKYNYMGSKLIILCYRYVKAQKKLRNHRLGIKY